MLKELQQKARDYRDGLINHEEFLAAVVSIVGDEWQMLRTGLRNSTANAEELAEILSQDH